MKHDSNLLPVRLMLLSAVLLLEAVCPVFGMPNRIEVPSSTWSKTFADTDAIGGPGGNFPTSLLTGTTTPLSIRFTTGFLGGGTTVNIRRADSTAPTLRARIINNPLPAAVAATYTEYPGFTDITASNKLFFRATASVTLQVEYSIESLNVLSLGVVSLVVQPSFTLQ